MNEKISYWRQDPIIIAILMLLLAQLGIYFYTPAFLLLASAFQTTESMIQVSLSGFLFSFGIGQFLMGLLADRSPVSRLTLIGLSFFFLGSTLCIFSKRAEFFIFARIIEGFGAGCLSTLARVHLKLLSIKEIFHEKMATYTIASVLVPALSPLLGSFVIFWLPWQVIFLILGISSALILLIYIKFKANHHAILGHQAILHYHIILKNIYILLMNPLFLVYSLLNLFCYTIFVILIMFSPAIFIKHYELSKQMFGLLMILPPLGFFFGSILMKKKQKRYNINRLLMIGLIAIFISGVVLIIFSSISDVPIIVTIICFFMIPFGNGFIMAPLAASACSLELNSSIKGTDVSLFGAIQILGASLLTSMIIGGATNYFYTIAGIAILLPIIGATTLWSLDRVKKG